MNENSLEYEDQVRAIATQLAVEFWKGTTRTPEDIMKSADEFACYIANGMTCEQYKDLQGEEFNVYARHKALDDNDD